MAGQSSQDVLSQTVDAFATRVQQYAEGIAGRLGQPLSGTQLSKDEAVARWNFSPLGSTQAADARYHQLVGQGTPPGQALDQVYPMRNLLIRGSDLQDSISTAKQIQGWAAEAAGTKPPEPFQGSTMPLMLAIQRNAQLQQQAAPQPLPAPPMPVQNALPAAPGPPPQTPPPMPAAPMPPPSPMPQQMPLPMTG